MECLAVPTLPQGLDWLYEIKFDGYRAIAVKSGGRLNLFSRRRNLFNSQYSLVFEALADFPDDTVIDGEVVALNESGRPDFNLLQHYRAEASRIHYFVFDLLVYDNRDLTQLSLVERRQIMKAVLKRRLGTCLVPLAAKGWKVSLLRGETAGTRLENVMALGPSTD
jgi:bifunctional non-homologous end joining protein LigD